jgi:hypothetical protein
MTRPAGIQVLFYVVTGALIAIGMRFGGKPRKSCPCGLIIPVAAASALLLQTPIAGADPAAKVHLPTVVQGEIEFELLGGYQWWRNNDENRLRQFIAKWVWRDFVVENRAWCGDHPRAKRVALLDEIEWRTRLR